MPLGLGILSNKLSKIAINPLNIEKKLAAKNIRDYAEFSDTGKEISSIIVKTKGTLPIAPIAKIDIKIYILVYDISLV